MEQQNGVRRIAFSAAVCALYAVLTMSTGFMSYGGVQFRIAEALCVLPFFFPYTAWGLFLGCVIANLISPAGIADVIFGSLATLAAEQWIAAVGRRHAAGHGALQIPDGRTCAAVCFIPVLLNTVVVGLVLTLTSAAHEGMTAALFLSTFAVFAGGVALGEAAVLFLPGLALLRLLPKSRLVKMMESGR